MASKKANPRGLAQVPDFIGAGERNRTLDLRITSALLYQLSYTGKPCPNPLEALLAPLGMDGIARAALSFTTERDRARPRL